MATDPDDGDEEWRYSLSDLEDEDGADAGSDASAEQTDREDEDGGLDAGVAGRMDFSEELEAGEIDIENALFVIFGVLLAIAFFVGFLDLLP